MAKAAKRLVLLLTALGATIVLLELAARVLWPQMTSSLGYRNVEIYTGSISPERAFLDRPHPYMLFENTLGFVSQDGLQQINAQGYRNAHDILPSPAPGVFRILCLGGSTTYGYLLQSFEEAWPAQLEELLNSTSSGLASSFNEVEVINSSLLYGVSHELLLHYLFRDRYLGSHLVIIHTGGNDIAPLLFDDYEPDYGTFRKFGAAHRLRRYEHFLLTHSASLRVLYAYWLNDAPALPYIQKQLATFDREEDYYTSNARSNEPLGFKRSLDLLIRNIKADGATPVLFPFTMPSEATYPELSPEARERAAYTDNIRKGRVIALEKNIDVMHELAATYDIPIVALSPDVIPSAYWLDHCHLSPEGEAIKASFLADGLSPLIANTSTSHSPTSSSGATSGRSAPVVPTAGDGDAHAPYAFAHRKR